MIDKSGVVKKVLNNGLTVLVRQTTTIPKVSVQLFYNVGSKDEQSGQRGLAHLIEHMIFKGTKTLSESDINMITHKLSGYCNAFTSYDYTGYLFDFPSQHWHEAFPILADCMRNCNFKQEYLNSEMKAVIQELKMYKDDYTSSLIEKMISTIFEDHPYHYPIIGFKQDLWSVSSKVLHDFYAHHYVPNNAVLVVAGDVNPEEVFAQAEKHFSAIPANPAYKKQELYHSKDIVSKETSIYRDVQQAVGVLGFEVPGARANQDYAIDVTAWVLGGGKSSRLYKKLVDDLQIATAVQVFTYNLFDYGLFFIYYQPKEDKDLGKIKEIIFDELRDIAQHGVTEAEVQRAAKQNDSEFLSMLENAQKQVDFIGKSYLATGDEHYLANYLKQNNDELAGKVHGIITRYLKPSVAHSGSVLPLDDADKKLWLEVQDISDQEDARILSQAERTSDVEPGVMVHQIEKQAPKAFSFPKPQRASLENGIKLFYYHNGNVPKVDIVLSLKAKHYYDPHGKEGLYNFLCMMLHEGTKNYSAEQFAQEFEDRGMHLSIKPGAISISCLSQDVAKAMELLEEVITRASLPHDSMEKIRTQLKTAITHYWDEPNKFVGSLIRKEIYKDHPYAKDMLGSLESIQAITHEDILKAYKDYFVPEKAQLAIVGAVKSYDVPALAEQSLGAWQGAAIKSPVFPIVPAVLSREINYPINRDQIVLAFAGKSVKRTDDLYDKVLLFDQIFTGGVLGSMSSRLFALREQSGLFYTIGGSLLSHTDEEPGMIYLRTIVSKDRLAEAEKAIEETINQAAHEIEDYEFEQARDALVNSLVEHFESNKQIAHSFLFIDRFGLPDTYFDTRAQKLMSVVKEEVIVAIKALLSAKSLIKVRVGRI